MTLVVGGGRSAERRRSPRYAAGALHGIVAVCVRPGCEGGLVNVSASGMLIETVQQLRPGALVDVQLSTADARQSVRGHVLRCAVWRVTPAGIAYRGAIAFDRLLPWFFVEGRSGYDIPGADPGGGAGRWGLGSLDVW
jgi:hypothetical protein